MVAISPERGSGKARRGPPRSSAARSDERARPPASPPERLAAALHLVAASRYRWATKISGMAWHGGAGRAWPERAGRDRRGRRAIAPAVTRPLVADKTVRAEMRSASAGTPSELTTVTGQLGLTSTPSRLSDRRAHGEAGPKATEQVVACLDEHDRAVRDRCCGSLRNEGRVIPRACPSSTPVDRRDSRRRGVARRPLDRVVGGLEREQDLSPDFQRIVERRAQGARRRLGCPECVWVALIAASGSRAGWWFDMAAAHDDSRAATSMPNLAEQYFHIDRW